MAKRKTANDRAIEYFENITPKSVEQYEAAHDAIDALKAAELEKKRLVQIAKVLRRVARELEEEW